MFSALATATPLKWHSLIQSADGSGVEESACRAVKNIGKPDAGKLHVRFDEGGQGETCSLLYL